MTSIKRGEFETVKRETSELLGKYASGPETVVTSKIMEFAASLGEIGQELGEQEETAIPDELQKRINLQLFLLSLLPCRTETAFQNIATIMNDIEKRMLAAVVPGAVAGPDTVAPPLPPTSEVHKQRLIDHTKNSWESFVVDWLGIEDLADQKTQMSRIMELAIAEVTTKNWSDPSRGQIKEDCKILGVQLNTTDGQHITFGQVLNTCPDRHFAKEIEDRLEFLRKVYQGGVNWYEICESKSFEPTQKHLDDFLFEGKDLQHFKELGYTPHGINFFDVAAEGIAIYETWNARHVYLESKEERAKNGLSGKSEEEKVEDLAVEKLLGEPLFTLEEFTRCYNFEKGRISDAALYQELINRATFFIDDYTKKHVFEQVVLSLALTFIEFKTTKKTGKPILHEVEFRDALTRNIIAFFKGKAEEEKQRKFGIHPVIQVGNKAMCTSVANEPVNERYKELCQPGMSNTEFYRKQIVRELANFIEKYYLNELFTSIWEQNKEKWVALSDEEIMKKIRGEADGEIEKIARQAELFAYEYYSSQAIAAKDDEIKQFSTQKMWRLISTGSYRSKYPSMEGAEFHKGTIARLMPEYIDYTSALVNIGTEEDPINKAYSLRVVFRDRDKRLRADFAAVGDQFRKNYIGNLSQLAEQIYTAMQKGMEIDWRKLGRYEQERGLLSTDILVIDSATSNKIDLWIRSTLGYWIDTLIVPGDALNSNLYNDNWTALKSATKTEKVIGADGKPELDESGNPKTQPKTIGRTIILDKRAPMITFPDDPGDGSKGELRKQFDREVDRIGLRSALQKWYFCQLLIGDFEKNKIREYSSDDEAILIRVLTGQLPEGINKGKVLSRYKTILGTASALIDISQAEVKGLLEIAKARGSVVNQALSALGGTVKT